MKTAKVTVVALLVIGLGCMFFPQNSQAEQKFGVGGKLIGKIPFLIGSLDLNQFGVEVGGGMRSSGTSYGTYSFDMSLTYYLANGRYIFPLNTQLQPYVGGGIVGASATVSTSTGTTDVTVSGQTSGYDIFGGIEFPLTNHGFPITVFGGMNYLGFEDMTFTYEGESFSYPIQVGETSFHVGVKFEF